jgi:diaminopimelate epimerase
MTLIPFTKAQAAGNDFLILEGSPERLISSPREIERLCDRRFGVGADGVVFLTMPAPRRAADAELRLFNSDGSEAEISGNGTRCAAACLASKGVTSEPLAIQTRAGLKTLRLVARRGNRWEFEMFMGAPILAPNDIPFHPSGPVSEPVVGFPLPLSDGARPVTVTSMGNPHCSLAVENFDWDWRACGKEIESHSFFPRRTNVEFYRIVSRHAVEARFWERGVGETLSSGTGSSAAAVAAILNHQAESPVTIQTPGGELQAAWRTEGVYLIGPAELTFHGMLYLSEPAAEANGAAVAQPF